MRSEKDVQKIKLREEEYKEKKQNINKGKSFLNYPTNVLISYYDGTVETSKNVGGFKVLYF